jgi:hypothetical protein
MRIYDAEQSALEQRISEAGWRILRDEHVADGYVVEYQQGSPMEYHLHAQTRKSTGRDRSDAYRRFLEELATSHTTR